MTALTLFNLFALLLASTIPLLDSGSAVSGSLAAGESASFAIAVPADTAAVVTIEQDGIDLRASLRLPAGEETVQSSSAVNGVAGAEVLVLPISPAPASWIVALEPVLPQAARGRFTIALSLEPAHPRARARAAAHQAFHDANTRDRNEGTSLAAAEEGLLAAAQAAASVDDRALEGEALYQAGLVQDLRGEHPRALETIGRALPIFEELQNRGRIAQALNRLGDLSRKIGEVGDAERFLAAALPVAQQAGDPATEGDILNNTGLLLSTIGRKEEAIAMLTAAVPLAQEVASLNVEAALHHNVGHAYWQLGDFDASIDAFERSMVVKKKMGSPRRLANTLNSMASVHFARGDEAAAIAAVREALELWEVFGSRFGTAVSLSMLGRIRHAQGELDAAVGAFAEAAPLLRELRDRNGEATVLVGWAEIELERGESEAAFEKLDRALELSRLASAGRTEAKVLATRAHALHQSGRLDEAIASIASAVEIVETMREAIARADLRSSYLAVVRDYYDLYIELLLERDRGSAGIAEAFRVSEAARARALLEGLAESASKIRKGVDPSLLARERAVQAELNAKETYRARLIGAEGKEKELERADEEIAALIESWRMLQAEVRRASPAYAALRMPTAISVERVQQALIDRNTILVEYHLGKRASRAWVVDAESITVHALAPGAVIEELARAYHLLLSRDRRGLSTSERTQLVRDLSDTGERLAAEILAPLGSRLGGNRLLVVADGALHYVPFGALPLPGSTAPLIESREVVYLPSASVLDTLRRDRGGRKEARAVAVFADPVFSREDPRLGGVAPPSGPVEAVMRDEQRRLGGETLPRLRFSRAEAAAIAEAAAERPFSALDFEASKQSFVAADLRAFDVVHIATHGALDAAHPELSGLVLSLFDERGRRVDGFLRLHEIYNLELDAELVVLSACQTALGKEVHGEGLIGVMRGFMYAGASRVISSIWNVDDRASARLMGQFYRSLLAEGAPPSAALRKAQLAMSRDARWRDPHYWAAFGLHGD